jgi:hypothetical protein
LYPFRILLMELLAYRLMEGAYVANEWKSQG